MDIFDVIAAGPGLPPSPPSPSNAPATVARLAEAEFNLSYSLAKQVPDMGRGFSISTGYGEIHFEPGLAANMVADSVRYALEKRLKNAIAARRRAEGSSHGH